MVEKAVNIGAKTNLQPPLRNREINFKCLKGYKLTKKNKNEINQKYWNEDKVKFYNSSSGNISQPQA